MVHAYNSSTGEEKAGGHLQTGTLLVSLHHQEIVLFVVKLNLIVERKISLFKAD